MAEARKPLSVRWVIVALVVLGITGTALVITSNDVGGAALLAVLIVVAVVARLGLLLFSPRQGR